MRNMLLVIIIIFSLIHLTSCNGTPNDTITDDVLKNQDNDDLINDHKKQVFSMLFAGEEPDAFKEVAKVVEEQCNLNIKLDFKWCSPVKYEYLVRAALESNNLDLYEAPYLFYKYIEDYKDLTDLMPKYSPVIAEYYSQDKSLNPYKIDGKLMFLPQMWNEPEQLLVDFREDYVKKYNIESINNINEYVELIKKISTEEGIIAGSINNNNLLTDLLCTYGYTVLDYSNLLFYKSDDSEMKLIPIEAIPQFEHTATLLNDLVSKKVSDEYNPKAISTLYKSSSTLHPAGWYTFNLCPEYKYYKTITRNVFNNSSNDVEIILKFFNWLYSNQTNYDLFSYGLKDTHYTLEDDKIKLIEPYTIDNVFKCSRFERHIVDYLPYDKRDTSNIKDSKLALHAGFSALEDTSFTREDICNQLIVNIRMGLCPNNILEHRIKQLKTKGTPDKVLNYYQKKLNEWLLINNTN